MVGLDHLKIYHQVLKSGILKNRWILIQNTNEQNATSTSYLFEVYNITKPDFGDLFSDAEFVDFKWNDRQKYLNTKALWQSIQHRICTTQLHKEGLNSMKNKHLLASHV